MLAATFSILILAFTLYAATRITSFLKNKKIIEKQSKEPLSTAQQKGLALGSILFAMKGESLQAFFPANTNTFFYSFGLKRQWDITNSAEAKDTIMALLARERTLEYDHLIEDKAINLDLIHKSISRKIEIPVEKIKDTASTYAWDLARAASLSKWCYWCGYITEEETWDFILTASNTATELGSDWQDYTISFLLGRTLQGFDLDDVGSIAKALLHGQVTDKKMDKIEGVDIYQKFDFKH